MVKRSDVHTCRAGDKLPTSDSVERLKEVMSEKYRNLITIGILTGFRITELLNLSLIEGKLLRLSYFSPSPLQASFHPSWEAEEVEPTAPFHSEA